MVQKILSKRRASEDVLGNAFFVWNKKWLKIGIYAGLRPRQMAYLMCQEPEGEKLEDHE